MPDESTIQQSLVEQILDEMFVRIESQSEFDAETTQRLKELAEQGNLGKERDVTRAIKSTAGGAS